MSCSTGLGGRRFPRGDIQRKTPPDRARSDGASRVEVGGVEPPSVPRGLGSLRTPTSFTPPLCPHGGGRSRTAVSADQARPLETPTAAGAELARPFKAPASFSPPLTPMEVGGVEPPSVPIRRRPSQGTDILTHPLTAWAALRCAKERPLQLACRSGRPEVHPCVPPSLARNFRASACWRGLSRRWCGALHARNNCREHLQLIAPLVFGYRYSDIGRRLSASISSISRGTSVILSKPSGVRT